MTLGESLLQCDLVWCDGEFTLQQLCFEPRASPTAPGAGSALTALVLTKSLQGPSSMAGSPLNHPTLLLLSAVTWCFEISFLGFYGPPPPTPCKSSMLPNVCQFIGWYQAPGWLWVGRDPRDHLVPTPLPWAGTSSTKPGAHVQTTGELQPRAHGW